METIRKENETRLVDLISKKIGYTIQNSSVANELLDKYQESSSKKVKSLNYDPKTGMLNSELKFFK